MIPENNLCKFLEWDSDFFGIRIASLSQETLTPESLESVLMWCAKNHIDCLYLLADTGDLQTTLLAERKGFHLTDIRVSLEIKLSDTESVRKKPKSLIQKAIPEDIEQLKKIASVNHRDSRFYYDGNFSLQKCDELFSVWIAKSCNGYADVVLVAKNEKVIDGYVTCSIDDKGNGSIGLVGVNNESQGKGVGKNLINSALDWFRNKNISYITVVTQGRNVKAQRLYQRNGFVTKSFKNWYHLWFT